MMISEPFVTPMSYEMAREVAELLHAVGHRHRLSIMWLLVHKPDEVDLTVGMLCRRLDVNRTSVSHHLRLLESARLIRRDRDGNEVLCAATPLGRDLILAIMGVVDPAGRPEPTP